MKLEFRDSSLRSDKGLAISASPAGVTIWAHGPSVAMTLQIAVEGAGRTYPSKLDFPELCAYNADYTGIRWREP